MFLSYAVVPVLVFTVLLNFFYLYAPIESGLVGEEFTTCEECLKSQCHTEVKRPCAIDTMIANTYLCFTCDPEPSAEDQFYTEADCKTFCTDPAKKCVCDNACWACIATEGVDLSIYECFMPTQKVDEKCNLVPYP